MGTIVVGMDGSPASKEALRWSVAEAERRGDVVRVVMAWENPYRDMWLPSNPTEIDPRRQLRARLERTVSSIAGEDPATKIETTVLEGQPARVLVDESRHADLLVVGSRGRSGFAGAVLGSVSAACAAHALCPVVIVRAPA